MSFGILTSKVKKYGVKDTVRYFSELNKNLTVEQKKKNAAFEAKLEAEKEEKIGSER